MISQVCEAESRICEVQSAGRKLRRPVHSRRKRKKSTTSNIRFKKERTDPETNASLQFLKRATRYNSDGGTTAFDHERVTSGALGLQGLQGRAEAVSGFWARDYGISVAERRCGRTRARAARISRWRSVYHVEGTNK